MPKIAIYNTAGQQVGDIMLSDEIFAAPVNKSVIHHVVRVQNNNLRQGTKSTLTRAEVRGGGRKPWRQKGTGRARQGSTRSPQWKHGGVIFAPKPRDFVMTVPKKLKRIALRGALTAKFNDNEIIVLDSISLPETRTTSQMASILSVFGAKKPLVITTERDELIERGTHNIQGVKTTIASVLNVLDILGHDKFIITKEAIEKVQEVYAG